MANHLVGVSWLANKSPDYRFPNQTKPTSNKCRLLHLQLHIAGFDLQVAVGVAAAREAN